jgi:hypothetical protein
MTALSAVFVILVMADASARADSLFPFRSESSTLRTFSVAGCGATDTATVSAPRGATQVRVLGPQSGETIFDEDRDAVFAQVTDSATAGRRVTFTVTGSDAACEPPGPDCAATGDGCPPSGRSAPVAVVIRYTRRERVYVTGTGRGGGRSYKPRDLPFGTRSAIVGLRWTGWGSATTVGRGRVEYNSCVPNCAQARPSYYPVRATLTRRRACNNYPQYLTLRFTYTTAARPAGLSRSYRENFGAVCVQ